jgi:tRNA pseudouridine13 synthase
MPLDWFAPPPGWTTDLPGIGGRIKHEPEDFEVEEIPAYERSGRGEFLFLWLEKRAMGAEYFARQVARRLGLGPGEVGTAGLKDRHAVTRQFVSVPARAADRLPELEGEGIRLLGVERHGNKLRPGHLRGNRFRVLIREPAPDAPQRLEPLLERLRRQGLANFYGPQRFGKEGETLRLGLSLLRGEPSPAGARGRPPRNPFLRKLALSAAQSALFNQYLAQRLADNLMGTVLRGDVMAKRPTGGLFVAADVPAEQTRFDRRETVHTGPIFGRKMFAAADQAADREAALLGAAGLTPASFAGFGKLLLGTRRHNVVYVDDLAAAWESAGLRLSFTLPAGSYATALLAEVMKGPPADADEP